MSEIKFHNADTNTVRSFSTVCELTEYLATQNLHVYESSPGQVTEQIETAAVQAGCAHTVVSGILVSPTADSQPTDTVGPDGDSPEDLGAPEADSPPSEVAIENQTFGEPGDPRDPSEGLHDAQNPANEGEVEDALRNQGMSQDVALDAVQRGVLGDPVDGEKRTNRDGESSREDAKGGDPVQLSSGLLSLSSVDLDVPSPLMPLRMERHYLSGVPSFSSLGFNWDHNWNVFLPP